MTLRRNFVALLVFAMLATGTGVAEAEHSGSQPGLSATDDPKTPGDFGIDGCDDVATLKTKLPGSVRGNPDINFVTAVQNYVAGRKRSGGIWIDRYNDGTLAVAFTKRLKHHRNAIGDLVLPDGTTIGSNEDFVFDLVKVRYSMRNLDKFRKALTAEMAGLGSWSIGSKADINRVSMFVVDPTDELLENLSEAAPLDSFCMDIARTPPVPSELVVIPDPDSDPTVLCRGLGAAPASTLTDPTPVEEVDHPAVDEHLEELERGRPESLVAGPWFVWSLGDSNAAFFTQGTSHGYARYEAQDGRWRLSSWGSSGSACRPRVVIPAGLGHIALRVNRSARPQANDTTLKLWGEHVECGSSELVGPQVIETETEVVIAFAAVVPVGFSTCEGIPPSEAIVELSEPLGDRVIRDGSFFPATKLRGQALKKRQR